MKIERKTQRLFQYILFSGLILFAVSLQVACASSETVKTYTSPDSYFSFALPNDWTERSTDPDVVKKYKPKFTTTFDSPEDDPAYIIVSEIEGKIGSYDNFEKSLESGLGVEAQNFDDKNPDFQTTYDQPYVDKDKNVAFLKVKIDRGDGSHMVLLSKIFLGKEGMVTVNLYTLESGLEQNLPMFEKMTNSFQWRSGYEWKPTGGWLSNFGSTAISAGFMGAFVALFGLNRKKEEKK